MPKILPISDLRNNFNKISEICHTEEQPVYITKNGKGDLVVTSHKYFEKLLAKLDLYDKLMAAEAEYNNGKAKLTHEEVFKELRGRYEEK
ncbi:type II toxin-antitoxin system Phd/YefM family antitoxin [Acidaminobacter sp. JC074]|uniref:type II toxin-antitoxin system Phd/YefM family antitoxin n=1 Tax=Acidaminobacter sp. JC074 TaxID=2530199 RepID=UPI001F0CFF0C|nr:type II toxin-antitoxin system Phd/YefM family antitoxin [Acidaminobacter sp. JC074]MCH4890637.1 type II toxin-antitoxin system Phd/YefM family antitoxin [Acidaminobacter sp. JC074]